MKAVIFDFGGVFTPGGSFRKFAEKYAKMYNVDAKSFVKIIYKSWDSAKLGKINSSKFWENISLEIGMDKTKFRKMFIEHHGFRFEILKYVKSLKGKYKLGMITNAIEDWFEENKKKYKLNDLFDVIITSYEMGKAKPDKEIFMECVKRLGVDYSSCVFIDDLDKNLLPAKELGINVVKFKNYEQMVEDLDKLGVR